MRVQREVPVEAAEREIRRLQFALGAPRRRRAVLVLERVAGRRVVVVLDLVMVVQQPGRERRGYAELRVVQRAHVADRQFQLELAVGVRKVPSVQLAHRYVVPVALGRAIRRELHLWTARDHVTTTTTTTIAIYHRCLPDFGRGVAGWRAMMVMVVVVVVVVVGWW